MFVGVVEGFYGPMWGFLDRLSMSLYMGRVGLNLYFYAPKDDPYHRLFWRDPYPSRYIDEFSWLVEQCRRFGVYFAYAISPGLDIDYSSREDIDILVRKLDSFMNLGVRILGVFLDDIPPELRGAGFKSLADAHSRLANHVYRELSPDRLFLVPTFYWGYEEAYLRELGGSLESGVEIVWTGTHVVSPKIGLDDIERFREISGRYPAIWDNYPVNDFFIVRGVIRLHMDYIKGRDPRIFGYIPAYMANPMNQAEASKIPLYSISRLARGYQTGEGDIDKAIELVLNEEIWDAFRLFTVINRSSPLDPGADLEPGENRSKEILEMVETIRRKTTNKKILAEISPVLSFLEMLGRVLSKGSKIEGKTSRIQAAGLYDPPISDESMRRVFGHVARRTPSWLATRHPSS